MKKNNTKKVRKKGNKRKKITQKSNLTKNNIIKDFTISMSVSVIIEIFKHFF